MRLWQRWKTRRRAVEQAMYRESLVRAEQAEWMAGIYGETLSQAQVTRLQEREKEQDFWRRHAEDIRNHEAARWSDERVYFTQALLVFAEHHVLPRMPDWLVDGPPLSYQLPLPEFVALWVWQQRPESFEVPYTGGDSEKQEHLRDISLVIMTYQGTPVYSPRRGAAL